MYEGKPRPGPPCRHPSPCRGSVLGEPGGPPQPAIRRPPGVAAGRLTAAGHPRPARRPAGSRARRWVAPRLWPPSSAPLSRTLGPRRGAVGEVRAGADQNNEADGACPASPCVCACLPAPCCSFHFQELLSPISQEFPPPGLSCGARRSRRQRRQGTRLPAAVCQLARLLLQPSLGYGEKLKCPNLVFSCWEKKKKRQNKRGTGGGRMGVLVHGSGRVLKTLNASG